MTSPADDIRRLLKLINTAAEDAIQQYESAGCEVPTPTSRTTPKLPEDVLPLKRSLRILEGACQQLVVTLTPPDIAIYTVSTFPYIACNLIFNSPHSGRSLLVLICHVSVLSHRTSSARYDHAAFLAL